MSTDGRFYELQDRDQPRLFAPSLRQAVEREPDVVALDAAVERLDLSELEARYSRVGHPAYPPRAMLKVLLYGYSLGLRSSRHLERACRMDRAFEFLAHGLRPDFRTLCRFRRRHADLLGGLFAQTVRLCQEAGLVRLGHVAVDGTKVRANRNAGVLKQARDALRDALAEAEAADADIADEEDEEDAGDDDAGSDAEEGSADAECDFMMTPDGLKPSYNAQLAVDGEHQVIVGQDVSGRPHDQGQLPEMVAQVQQNCRGAPAVVSADGGYYSRSSLEQVESEQTQVYVPVPEGGSSRFEWVAELGAYRCSQGHVLKPYRVREGSQVYRTHRCTGCPEASECGVTGRFKEVREPVRGSVADRVKRRMRSAAGQGVYGRRAQIVEPVIGVLKHNRGFRRFLLHGSVGAGAEWSLLCIAHNLAKWAKAVLPQAGGPGGPRGASSRRSGAHSGHGVAVAFWRVLQRVWGRCLHLPLHPALNPESAA